MTRLLFVCLGNICRSPLAEAIFNHKTRERNLGHRYKADSCGTSRYNVGDQADPRTRASGTRNGVRVHHLARQLHPSDLDRFDHILVMDINNLRETLALSGPENRSKVEMIRNYDPAGPGNVPDPYYGGEDDFQKVFEMLDRTIEHLLTVLEKRNQSSPLPDQHLDRTAG